MESPICPPLRPGLTLAALCAVAGIALARLPFLASIGSLTTALLLGIVWRAFRPAGGRNLPGLAFASKSLLRWGIVLLGVRLDFGLLARAGTEMLILAAGVIAVGLLLIPWLGRRFGLSGALPWLIAVDSSICGASAVAAAGPVLRACEAETALVIPLGSLLGSAAVLGYTAFAHVWHMPPELYGMLTGSTLHEVAQVLAAGAAVPGALESGTVAKLTRVVLLVPVVFLLGVVQGRKQDIAAGEERPSPFHHAPWFVLGFFGTGAVFSILAHLAPQADAALAGFKAGTIALAMFLMGMAMGGVGLQVDFTHFRAQGLRALAVALIGWGALVAFVSTALFVMGRMH